ncbi:MAG TPA: gliding motility lipoprotein GldD [Gillisia sp.]|nr:gliding motility lipoprotein GldD [Gillisia sp.]
MNKVLFLFGLVLMFSSCKNDHLPKPKAFLALEYPAAEYSMYSFGCPYQFEKNQIAEVNRAKGNVPCWININYPLLDATIFITYQRVNNNIDSLLRDAQRMPLQHTIKADFIEGDIYTNNESKTYGMFYEIEGNAASQAQFYITDSIKHFITGSLYFNQKPNYDSIMPAAAYLKTDMKHLMETIKWDEGTPETPF